MKKSIILLAAALALLIVSFVPWPGDAPSPDDPVPETPATPISAPLTPDAGRGRALFVAKGCVACHQHQAVDRGDHLPAVGPNLSYYAVKASSEFLRQWLRNPPAVRPATVMPNLNLSDDEIEDLIAFLKTNALDDSAPSAETRPDQ